MRNSGRHVRLRVIASLFSLCVAALAPTVYAQPSGSNIPESGSVVFPSGKSLAAADFYSLSCVKATAGQLLDAVLAGRLDASCMNFDGSLVLYGVKQQNPVGYAVSFWPGKDPQSCYQRKLEEARLAKTRSQPAPAEVWDDVAVRCCTHYDAKGNFSGWLMLWNEDGTKQYFRDSGRGLSCLFQQDQLRTVVEHGAGSAFSVVHLMSGWKIEKTFASAEEAKDNGAAQAALDEIERTAAVLKTADGEFRKATQKALGSIHRPNPREKKRAHQRNHRQTRRGKRGNG